MHKLFVPTLLAGGLMMSGCAAGLGGDSYGGGLGSVFGGGGSAQINSRDFERAAVDSCSQEASRYGDVRIENTRMNRRDTVRVDGSVRSDNRRARGFSCTFRSDGRIVDFRI